MITRFPVVDISPTTYFGGEFVAAKAIPHEAITIGATVFREGHDSFEVFALLFDSAGKEVQRNPMRLIWPGTDRYEGVVTPTTLGTWSFAIAVQDEKGISSTTEKYPIFAEDPRALIGAWYEFFPRSEGAIKNSDGTITSGTFKTAQASLKRVADMGFDILYLPPIHPIGLSFRKGKNNSTTAKPGEPGVPWGIGSSAGGHDAINPELGTLKDFQEFVAAAKKLKIEIALDLALQC